MTKARKRTIINDDIKTFEEADADYIGLFGWGVTATDTVAKDHLYAVSGYGQKHSLRLH